jgi:ribonuclease HI
LWRVLDDALANSEHSITWHLVKGHSGNPGNDRADALANEGVRLFQAG